MKADVLKNKAEALRKKGYSFREISEKLGVSKSTVSLWARDVELTKQAKERITRLGVTGRNKAAKTVEKRIAKENEIILKRVENIVASSDFLKTDLKIACALLYWCEGGKTDKGKLSFMSSDPKLIEYFIKIFRKAFSVDGSKFRALIHVHSYHDIEKQTKFWSDITGISEKQFNKPFRKENSGKRKKENYQGCISVRYYGRVIAKEMMFLIREISK